jgi:NAD(P)-dependent dehydrogenase (short-subunit alcohol dehydrogenase family)
MSHMRAIRAALPAMRERGGGAIVNVSSTAGKRPSTGMPHYSVTKAALLSLSRLVADLYAKDGIRCNAVTPGPTATDAWLGDGGWPTSWATARPCSQRSARPSAGQARTAG